MQLENHANNLQLSGRFDAHEADAFRTSFESIVSAHGGDVHLDLAAVDFIDSTALAEIVRAMKRCREGGHELVIVGVSDPVRVILELTRLDQALTIR